ncbi:hypothetical protein BDZ97DRAFT_1106739 [Flammula alnicola]|nr:hypothetical protein BDZ97DRAFT_1106739 [Flammula alnicola]
MTSAGAPKHDASLKPGSLFRLSRSNAYPDTPTAGFSQFAIVTIDRGTPVNTSYGTVTPPAYVQWYRSPVLPDGKHTITVDHLDGTAVDMAIITVASNTPLSNKKVFVEQQRPRHSVLDRKQKWSQCWHPSRWLPCWQYHAT